VAIGTQGNTLPGSGKAGIDTKNLTAAYTDPDINMPKAEYLDSEIKFRLI